MNVVDKIIFLQNSTNLTDREFCKKYHIDSSSLKEWKKGKKFPLKSELKFLINSFNIKTEDFLDESYTLDKSSNSKEKLCRLKNIEINKHELYEDFSKEDNIRYEEKD